MKELTIRGKRINIGLTKDVIAIIISVISFLVSTVSVYFTNLQAPKINFETAPYMKHVVDDSSRNEAFFIPLTIINRGAKPGTVLSFELNVTHTPGGETQTYYGQYFTANGSQTNLGDFFTPITLFGASSTSYTICFYPIGVRPGNFFAETGQYDFEIVGRVANVKGESAKLTNQHFYIQVTDDMVAVMEGQPDGEYVYPLPIQGGS